MDVDLRIVKCFEALHFSFLLLEHQYTDLYSICAAIRSDRNNIIPALSRCWGIIDVVHRIREVSQAIPALSQKTVELKIFLQKTQLVEEYRHYIQHLRNELLKQDPNPFPVWGSLSWVDPEDSARSLSVVFGSPSSNYGSRYDIENRKWGGKVTLSTDKYSFEFDRIYEATIKFRDFIIPWIASQVSGSVSLSKPPVFWTKMDHSNPDVRVTMLFGKLNDDDEGIFKSKSIWTKIISALHSHINVLLKKLKFTAV